MIKVMFVCLGNICRSPMAEAILVQKAKKKGLSLFVESCGTAGYHIGEQPDIRTIETCESHGAPIDHKAQQLKATHFQEFDYLIVMDQSNKANVLLADPQKSEYQLSLMTDFDLEKKESTVNDPWYGDITDFEKCYETLDRCTEGFLHFLVEKHKLRVQ